MGAPQTSAEIRIRPLIESDLPDADRIVRIAFGTFLGLPDPVRFMGDADFAHTRWKADPSAVFAAEHQGRLIGSNFATNWGSFGFFGPLTVHPDYWDRGVAKLLMAPTMDVFRRWGNRHLGLYTFAHSPKHMALYQKFGFWPRDLVAAVAKPLNEVSAATLPGISRVSEAGQDGLPAALAACREVTGANFEGLDVSREIRAVAGDNLGGTILVWDDDARLSAFGVCHVGPMTEAGSGVCYVKFAAVRPDVRAAENFSRLLHACESFGRERGAKKLLAGVNLARREAFNHLRALGYRTEFQGVAMETGSASAGYNRAGVYILDDWR
jgi:GNAT superfamily N-acetyltransferase